MESRSAFYLPISFHRTPVRPATWRVTYCCDCGVSRCIAESLDCPEGCGHARAGRTYKPSLVCRDQVLSLVAFEDSKDMVMNSRAFLCFTLVPVVWFCASRTVASRYSGDASAAPGQNVNIGTPSLLENAQAGDANAEYQIGWSYFTGKGVPVDYKEAARWLRQSAAQGFPDAEFAL